MPNQGSLCKDIIGANLYIKGKRVIDTAGNLKIPGSIVASSLKTRGNTTVCEILKVDTMEAKEDTKISINSNIDVATTVTTTTLNATTVNATTLDVTTVDATTVNATTVNATTVDATTVDTTTVDTTTVNATTVNTTDIDAVNGNITTVNSTTVTTTGNVNVCGNLHVDNIDTKTGSNVNVFADLCVTGNVKSEESYFVDGLQVVTNRQGSVSNTNGNLASTSDTCNLILQVLRTHGLISSPP